MARKKKPILGRAWDLIGSLSITPIATKVKRPIVRKLLLFKRSKNQFKLLRFRRRYDQTFIREYEFSPSDTPLFYHHKHHFKKRCRLLCLLCGGSNGNAASMEYSRGELDEFEILSDEIGREAASEVSDCLSEEDDRLSVDGRAESFIKKFYEEMKMQRQESLIRYSEMLH